MIDVPSEFLAFLKDEEARAEDSDTDARRAVALDFYNGEPFGDEEEGRSQLVTRDVAEVVDYMTVSLLRTIVSGDRVVEFEGRSLAQDQQSDDATETVTQNFMRRQKGYSLVHDWIKAGLVEITGVVKTYAEPQEPKRRELHGVSALALVALQSQGHKVIEAEEAGGQDEQGAPLLDIAFLEQQPTRFCDYAVPNEEFRCAPDARDLDGAVYLAHVPPKTLSDLARMGVGEDDLAALESASSTASSLVGAARDGNIDTASDRRGANRRVAYREEYVLYDLNGDGVAERLMVQRVGNHVLALAEVDDHPFEEWCPFPMPHRRIGQSLAEKVMDIQRTRSVVLRQTMDGFYFSNAPRTFVNEDSLGESTIEDLLTVRPGSIVRFRGQVPIETQAGFNVGAGLSMLEQLIGERESRTGITRLNQGLDADTLNKTATGTALMQAQGQQIEEYLARNFAEALARLFAKKLKVMKRHGGLQPLRVDGKFRTVDPSQWDEEMDLAIRVGIGSGRKDQRLAYRSQIAEFQKLCLQTGLRMVQEQHVYNSLKGMIADMGLGNINDYAADPSQLPAPDPNGKPDPEAQKAQAELQLRQADLQQRQQESAARLQLQQQKEGAKIAIERSRAEAEAALARARAQFEAELAREKAAQEYALARARLAHEREIAALNQAEAAIAGAPVAPVHGEGDPLDAPGVHLPDNREGGDLSK